MTDHVTPDVPQAPGAALPSLDAERGPTAGHGVGDPEHEAGDGHPWSDADRPRGLDSYFPPGGEDDAPPERVADERRLTWLLVLLVVILVGVPTLLTFVALAGQLLSMRGG